MQHPVGVNSMFSNVHAWSVKPMACAGVRCVRQPFCDEGGIGFVTRVQTTESARPKEINDRQFLALLSDKQVALVQQGADKADLII
jgi:hypothetical protein